MTGMGEKKSGGMKEDERERIFKMDINGLTNKQTPQ